MKTQILFPITLVIIFLFQNNLKSQSTSLMAADQNAIFLVVDKPGEPNQIQGINLQGGRFGNWAIEYDIEKIAVDLGHVFVTINNNHRGSKVLHYDYEGNLLSQWQVDGKINNIEVSQGVIYVTINNDHRIYKYSSNGESMGVLEF